MGQDMSGDLGRVSMSEIELELIINRAAEAGARKALHDIGLHDDYAADDVKELRGLLDSWREAKDTALKTFVGWLTKGFLVAIAFGLWYQIRGEK
jgi:hypothetical protein